MASGSKGVLSVEVEVEGLIEKPLTPLKHSFVIEYLKDGNAAKAAERCGCKGTKNTFKNLGFQMLRDPEVQKAIKEAQGKIIERANMTRDDIIAYFIDTAREGRGLLTSMMLLLSRMRRFAEMYGYLKKAQTKKEEEMDSKNRIPSPTDAFVVEGDDNLNIKDDIASFLKLVSDNKDKQ